MPAQQLVFRCATGYWTACKTYWHVLTPWPAGLTTAAYFASVCTTCSMLVVPKTHRDCGVTGCFNLLYHTQIARQTAACPSLQRISNVPEQ